MARHQNACSVCCFERFSKSLPSTNCKLANYKCLFENKTQSFDGCQIFEEERKTIKQLVELV